jgi:hypothetical protein
MTRFRFGAREGERGPAPRSHAHLLLAGVSASILLLRAVDANALPSFARQTGLACSACHTTFLELTPFGRAFKLHGYTTLALKDVIEEKESDKAPPLEINRTFPLSVMFQTSLTRTNQAQPGTQNSSVEFPQQLSIFLAGEITPHIGTFLQATYSGLDGSFTLDNTDIRFADDTLIDGKELLYGATLNNNPTVEDPWNSTPAWGYPFASADSAPEPDAATLVDGVLAQQVAGLGAYAMWNKHLYGNVSLYRSAQINPPQPMNIRGVTPYWRLAWQQNLGANYLMVGTYGLFAELYPSAPSGPTDKFTDVAFDTQYERPLGADFLSAHFTYIFQNEQLPASDGIGSSSNKNGNLNSLKLDAIYHWRSLLAFYFEWFLIQGRTNALLYAPPDVEPGAPPPVTGSASGSPNSDGLRFEIAYYPWQNVRFSAMYTVYTQFNGASSNYNDTGRSASANDTLYVLAWLNY